MFDASCLLISTVSRSTIRVSCKSAATPVMFFFFFDVFFLILPSQPRHGTERRTVRRLTDSLEIVSKIINALTCIDKRKDLQLYQKITKSMGGGKFGNIQV